MSELTQLLDAMKTGEDRSADELLPLVYRELRAMAGARMRHEQPGQTLQATALVHEAWLRLNGGDAAGSPKFENPAHFFAAASEAMRRILIDRARRKLAARRGAGAAHVDLEHEEVAIVPGKEEELLAVHEVLDALAAHDARKAALVKLHYFGGFTLAEAADILGVAEPTARRDWAYARAWLRREIERS